MDWYPREPQAYRNDTWHLSLAEHGAYILLLDYYYLSENPLPNNDNALASIIGCSLSDWLSVKENVTRYYRVTNACLTHNKCDTVIDEQLGKRRDNRSRQNRFREKKSKLLEKKKTVTRDKRVSHAPRGEERRGEEDSSKELSIAFDHFWSIYPRRIAKKNAEKIFSRILKSGVSHEEIIDGARRYANHCRDTGTDEKYIAHAATWLNGERWLDRPEHAGGPDKKNKGGFSAAAERVAARLRGEHVAGPDRYDSHNVIDITPVDKSEGRG